MDAGGGMMMLEELDGVGIEWEQQDDGRKVARFVVSFLSLANRSM
jgi:ATP-dependent RNA helicase DDX24/MAK5